MTATLSVLIKCEQVKALDIYIFFSRYSHRVTAQLHPTPKRPHYVLPYEGKIVIVIILFITIIILRNVPVSSQLVFFPGPVGVGRAGPRTKGALWVWDYKRVRLISTQHWGAGARLSGCGIVARKVVGEHLDEYQWVDRVSGVVTGWKQWLVMGSDDVCWMNGHQECHVNLSWWRLWVKVKRCVARTLGMKGAGMDDWWWNRNRKWR